MQARTAGISTSQYRLRRMVPVFAIATITLLTGAALADDAAPTYRCARGKPSYCFKYGQSFCLKHNNRADAKVACEAWIPLCLDCQTAIHDCLDRLGGTIKDGSQACTKCHEEMSACMAKIDQQYWPNRL